MYASVPKLGVDNVASSSSVFEVLLLSVRGCSRNESVFKSPLYSATNKFAYVQAMLS